MNKLKGCQNLLMISWKMEIFPAEGGTGITAKTKGGRLGQRLSQLVMEHNLEGKFVVVVEVLRGKDVLKVCVPFSSKSAPVNLTFSEVDE